MNKTEQEERIIDTMLKACSTREECKKWIAQEIQVSYTKAENMRTMQNLRAVRLYYKDISTFSRLSFYLDELTHHLPD